LHIREKKENDYRRDGGEETQRKDRQRGRKEGRKEGRGREKTAT